MTVIGLQVKLLCVQFSGRALKQLCIREMTVHLISFVCQSHPGEGQKFSDFLF